MRLAYAVGLVLVSAALTACTSNSANPNRSSSSDDVVSPPSKRPIQWMEDQLEGQIDQKLSVAGTEVDCPSSVAWQVGSSFRCDVTAPGSPPGYAEVTIESDDGKYRWYIANQ